MWNQSNNGQLNAQRGGKSASDETATKLETKQQLAICPLSDALNFPSNHLRLILPSYFLALFVN